MGLTELRAAKNAHEKALEKNRTIPADQLQNLRQQLGDDGWLRMEQLVQLHKELGAVRDCTYEFSLLGPDGSVNWEIFPEILRTPLQKDAERGQLIGLDIRLYLDGVLGCGLAEDCVTATFTLTSNFRLDKELARKRFAREPEISHPIVNVKLHASVARVSSPFLVTMNSVSEDMNESYTAFSGLRPERDKGVPFDENDYLQNLQYLRVFDALLEVFTTAAILDLQNKTEKITKG